MLQFTSQSDFSEIYRIMQASFSDDEYRPYDEQLALFEEPGVRGIEFLHFHISVVCLLSLTRVRLCRINIRHIRTCVLKMQTPGYAENSRIQFPARPALLAALRKE